MIKMNILMIGPNKNNATDGVIIRGIEYLISRSYPDHYITYRELNDIVPQSKADFFHLLRFDLIVIAGTPWLWDSFQNSVKWQNLLVCLLDAHPQSKRLFMGIGSCLTLYNNDPNILCRPEEQAAMRSIYNSSTVIVRDSIAFLKLAEAGIKSHFLPCPAYFCYGDEKPSQASQDEKNIFIWVDPKQTISAIDWQDSEKLIEYYNICLDFYKKFNPTVYCTSASEISTAIKIGLPAPILLSKTDDTLNLMRGAHRVLSGRVHCAVPAIAQRANVGLMALDTRSYVVKDFQQFEDLTPFIEDYKKILKGLL